ncbi:hypothetical protein [Actinocorallia sp. A-T 12471]|uniref:hypothetical protein n=1 Tax=Actinocorallia sp. A-T 12471 TaxID=3089813 RepID=UPI0029CD0140|nr:hypothetical protein [Actinocorallia sp. A-T 12471]MDX6743950.1 hypothetical protein [Actinocorallia sp. A-T 12471]
MVLAKSGKPKLPAPVRRSIRSRCAEGEVTLGDLSTEYSVGRSTVHGQETPGSATTWGLRNIHVRSCAKPTSALVGG